MADITICINTDCPHGVTCWRFNAPPGDWQSYARFEPDTCGEATVFISGTGAIEMSVKRC